MNFDQVLYDLFAVSSGQSCQRLYLPWEAQGGPSDGPGKLREGPREGLWEAQEESWQFPGRPREGSVFILFHQLLAPLHDFLLIAVYFFNQLCKIIFSK